MNIWSQMRSWGFLWGRRLRGLVRRHSPLATSSEIDEELQFHIEARTAANIAAGMKPEDAAREARKCFGNAQNVREDCREANGASLGESLWRDIRLALRQLAKSPGFTLVAMLSLGLGIGAGTAVFSLVNAILLNTLPVPNPQELRLLKWAGSDVQMSSYEGSVVPDGKRWTEADCVTHPAFLHLREQCAGKADIFGFCPLQEAVANIKGQTLIAGGMMVSESFFSGLEVRPGIGRLLREGEDYGPGMNVVITYSWWEKYFALDPGVLGKSIVLNNTAYTIIGVLPRDFTGVRPGDPCDFYVPMSAASPFLYMPITGDFHWFVRLMARLRPGASDAQLKAALDVAFARETNKIMKDPSMAVEQGRGGTTYDRHAYRKPLLLMLGVVGMVMLVACANLAGLSLARGIAHQHELAVCAALGASRWRLIRQSLTENLVLAVLGGSMGILLAIWGRTAIARLLAGSADGLHYHFTLDFAVLSFSLALAFATAVLSGLMPALRAAQVDPGAGLKSRGAMGARHLRAGRVLVTAQICVSLLLLAGAGLYVRTLVNLKHVNAGFPVEKLLVVEFNTQAGSIAEAGLVPFYERTLDAVTALPGVGSATLAGFPLLADKQWSGGVQIRGRQIDAGESSRLTVSETFFSTLGIPILLGRAFEAKDTAEAPKAVIVNESFVRTYLPNENPIGLTCSILGKDWQIVGVCRDAKYDNIKKIISPTTYFPFRQMFFSPSLSKHLRHGTVVVRTTLPPMALSTAVRKAVDRIDPGVAITSMTSQEELVSATIGQERLLASLCGALAIVAVFLACMGIYGLMAYNVARRTSEIGIRMALGATRGNITGPILREALFLAATGAAIGVPLALALSRFVKSQLYGVEPAEPVNLAMAVAGLLVIALAAAWMPARRAARVDPLRALREE